MSGLHVIVHVSRRDVLLALGARATAVDLTVMNDRASFDVLFALATAFVRGAHDDSSVKGEHSFDYTKQITRFFKVK